MNFKDKVKAMVSAESFAKLEKYVELIEEKNKVMNLTGFKGDRLWEEGIFESIDLLQDIPSDQEVKLLDIGAGAGFPSVPFAIANPNVSLTIYEPIAKRCKFLELVNEELNLGIEIKNIRAEETEDDKVFDYVTARAVASLKALVEISYKPLKIGAKAIFIKGPKAQEELADANKIVHIFKIKPEIKQIIHSSRENNLVIYTKEKETPIGYPREWKIIVK